MAIGSNLGQSRRLAIALDNAFDSGRGSLCSFYKQNTSQERTSRVATKRVRKRIRKEFGKKFRGNCRPTRRDLFLVLGVCRLFLESLCTPHPRPTDGAALNPLLQDIGLALHPPVLYLGYVGLSLAWAQAAASLLLHRPAQLWATETLPWLLLAWSALTAGLGLGSLWAYYELGWGGWWFWDPVENLALMPWLVATAALHGVAACRRFALHAKGAQLLCLLAWLLALLATFVVRSGLLTSVHSFALDPQRGLAAFAILSMVAIFSFALYLRSGLPRQNHNTENSSLSFFLASIKAQLYSTCCLCQRWRQLFCSGLFIPSP